VMFSCMLIGCSLLPCGPTPDALAHYRHIRLIALESKVDMFYSIA